MKKFDMGDGPVSQNLNGATIFVKLPTGGLFYPETHPLYEKEKIEVKMLTTKEEEILTNVSYIDNGVVIEKLLENIVLVEGFNAKEIFDIDQMAIMIAARIDAYDEDYPVILDCTSCSTEIKHQINLQSVLDNIQQPEIERTSQNTSIVELPKSKKMVEYRVLLPVELMSIEKTVEKLNSMNIKTSHNQEFYKRIILSVDGETDSQKISDFINNLKIKDSRFLLSAYQKSLPKLDTVFSTACPACGKVQEGGMPFQANFFFPEF